MTYGRNDIISVANMYFKPDSYITDDSYLLTYNIFELGDIAFEGNKSKNYAHGRFVENTIGNGIVSHVFDVFKPIMNPYDLLFWKYAINNERLMGSVLLRSTKASTMMTNLVATDFLQESFLVPTYPEQQKIGAFFSQLDNLITLHQRKCALLFSPFQALISMMFTTSTFSWEQRKVSDMFKVTRGYVLAATLTNDTKSDEMPYPVYSSQTKDFGLMGYYRDYLYENSITWTTDGANAGTVNYRAGKFYCTNVCGVLLSDKVNASQMIAEALNNVAKGYVSYVGNPKLMNNVMSDIEIMIPVSPMEQKRISDYFATLDHLITLHQRKPFLMKWRTSDANRNQTNRLVL